MQSLLRITTREMCDNLSYKAAVTKVRFDRVSWQESTAIADKPARRESVPQIAPIRRAYNVVADNTGLSSFV